MVSMSRLVRWLPLAAIVVLLGAAMLASAFGNPSIDVITPPPPATQPAQDDTAGPDPTATAPLATPTQDPPTQQLPGWLAVLITVLCTGFVVAIAATMLWIMFRDRFLGRGEAVKAPRPGIAPTLVETRLRVQAAVDEGLAELDEDDADPRRVIINCWVRLERAGAAAGTTRLGAETPAEFVARLLAGHQVSVDVLEDFAAVYREARYASHAVDATMRDQARAALLQLRDELANPAAANTDAAGGTP